MHSLHDVQKSLRDQALDRINPSQLVELLKDDHPFSPEERLEIYRNNTIIGLTDALAAAYPVVVRLVGQDFFAILARDFIHAHPPKRAPMLMYGGDLPQFIAGYAPANGLTYLPDVARLEAAWNHAYHAEEADPLAPDGLQAFSQEVMGALTLSLHPSLRFVASDYPILEIWRANQLEIPQDRIIRLDAGADRLIVYRPQAEVFIRQLSVGAFCFLMALGTGQPLETAWDSARTLDRNFNITLELSALLAGGVFIKVGLS